MKYYVGVDLGGTKIACGVVNENYEIISRSNKKTNLPKNKEQIADIIVEIVHESIKNANIVLEDVEYIGIGIPGIIDSVNGKILFASNFDFENVNMSTLISERINKKIFIENDANVAVYGESLNGKAKNLKKVIMLTLGTGVGGGIIIDGKIYSGFNFLGAELGHVGIVKDGKPCLCGNNGCIEMYCSGTALVNLTKEYMENDKSSLMWNICDNILENANGRTAFLAKEKGDKAGTSVANEFISNLCYAITNYVNIFQPEIIILGGGVSGLGDKILLPIQEYVKSHALGFNSLKQTKISIASLGNDAGIIGAAFLGKLK